MTPRRAPRLLIVAKAVMAALTTLLFLAPIATAPGLFFGAAGALVGYLLAHRAAQVGVRLPSALALGLLALAMGYAASQLVVAHPMFLSATTAIVVADVLFWGLTTLGFFFSVHLSSEKVPVAAMLELVGVVAVVVHVFADHRHYHIERPRYLSDWSWSRGIDPTTLLVAFGVAALVLGTLMLLDTRRPAKLISGLALLGLVLLLLPGATRIEPAVHTNGLALTKGEKSAGSDKESKSGGGQSGKNDKGSNRGSGTADKGGKSDNEKSDNSVNSKNDKSGKSSGEKSDKSDNKSDNKSDDGATGKPQPTPVAVALLHDELPAHTELLYFREAVLSRFSGNRLVEDNSGTFDRDVISRSLGGGPLRAESQQNPALHVTLHSSVYLLVDHAQVFGLGQPFAMRAIDSPNPRRFLAAYDVDSYLLEASATNLLDAKPGTVDWSPAERAHYTAHPADPRYQALSDRILTAIDPRFANSDLVKAFAIKRYLEKNGIYNDRKTQLVGTDPTGQFLFGDLRGYCVHFAHAAALLFRTQGIPARVALGYGVETRRAGAGGAVLIFDNQAHAWPEIFLRGVGWVTFDIYPERSEVPPAPLPNVELQRLLGELARKDQSGGHAAQPRSALVIPWRALWQVLLALLGALIIAAYCVKVVRRFRAASPRAIYIGVLDRFTAIGAARAPGESRERHAERAAEWAPSFVLLTREHLRGALGDASRAALTTMIMLARATRHELRQRTPALRRLGALINPIDWWFTR
jgi:transglutaminase-like putative cysteine protease